MRLLDEMAGAEVPPSPHTSKQQADDRMWAELGEGDNVDSLGGGGTGEKGGSSGGSGGVSSANGFGGPRKGGSSRSQRRRDSKTTVSDFEDSKRDRAGQPSFRWTEKHEGNKSRGTRDNDDYLSFGDEDDAVDGGRGSSGDGGGDDDDDLEPMHIKDLDVFFTQVYTFFKEKGLWCMVTSRLINLVNLGFTIFFSTFLFLFVDWQALSVCGEGDDGQECGNFSSYVDWDLSKSPFSFWQGVVVFYFVTFCVFWLWTLFSIFPVIK